VRYYRVATVKGPRWAREDEGSLLLLDDAPVSGARETGEVLPLKGARLVAPVTLLPGDMISTGTPAGIGPLLAGDEVEVEGVGVLRNPVVDR
jgi:uncharacterized protein DUF2437/fumarylacetoacetase-like protein